MRLSESALSAAVTAMLLMAVPAALHAQPDASAPAQIKKAKKKAEPKAKTTEPKGTAGKKSENEKGNTKKGTTKVPPALAALPIAERAAIQFDLNWTNHYSGLADGEHNERVVAAVKAFQKERGFRDTGALTESEREALATSARARRERVGWRMVEDRVNGAQLGLPAKLVTHESRGRSGTRWQTAQGQLQIETFRIREPGATLASVFQAQKHEPPSRQIASATLGNGGFVLTGLQGLKRLLVRAETRDLEIRGVTVLYDQAIESTTDPIGFAVLSAFAPFPGRGVMALIAPPSQRLVEYGSGVVVTAGGYVLTDRRITEGCNVLQVAGHGDASRIAERDSVALLRVFGAAALLPAALVHDGMPAATSTALTLVGIADPQAQNGERAVSQVAARLDDNGLHPPPQIGFAGAAALDGHERLAGLVTLKAPVSPAATTPPAATIVPVAAIRQFLDASYVTPATGAAGVDVAKASVVRVICVRR